MAEDAINCPKCGFENPSGAVDCENCGISFEIYSAERQRAVGTTKELKTQPAANGAKPSTDGLAVCPSCGHPTDLSSQDCLKCGIVFSKYFDIQERSLADDPEKLEALKNQKAAHEKAVKIRETREARVKAEAEKRQRAEREKAEALKKQRAMFEKAAADEKKTVEEQKASALMQQKSQFEQDLAKLKERGQLEKIEALKKQREELDRIVAQEKEKAETDKTEALKKQKEQLARQQEEALKKTEAEKEAALKEQQAAFEAAEAERQKEAQALLDEAMARQRADLEKNREMVEAKKVTENLPVAATLKDRLKKYEGQTIGINMGGNGTLCPAMLLTLSDDHFSIFAEAEDTLHSYPYKGIKGLSECAVGLPLTPETSSIRVSVIVRVAHP